MSIPRTCSICGAEEQIRVNFGDNLDEELAFHRQGDDTKLCEISKLIKCEYNPHDYDGEFPDDWDEFHDGHMLDNDDLW